MSREVSVEATGETVGEAKWKALRDLERLAPGVDTSSVRFQVVSEGERGLLGVGYAPARVVASADAPGEEPEPGPRPGETELATHVRELVETVVGAIGTHTRVEVHESGEELAVTCLGGDVGLLIGKHGQTIDALQHVVNAAVHRLGAAKSVTVDAAGYRERRRATLEGIALRAAGRAERGERVALEPMTPVERKVVHERLKDVPGIQTASEGTEPNRYVVVLPA
ncbi:MAG TPA: RNA-binding cell elongation regulator Jag/EloR [Gaiellaceae bacterium]|nr:RNA-binding cell elongation regulator Jag/EloR [Gaiellaceae bacterium]